MDVELALQEQPLGTNSLGRGAKGHARGGYQTPRSPLSPSPVRGGVEGGQGQPRPPTGLHSTGWGRQKPVTVAMTVSPMNALERNGAALAEDMLNERRQVRRRPRVQLCGDAAHGSLRTLGWACVCHLSGPLAVACTRLTDGVLPCCDRLDHDFFPALFCPP